jgi:hypothetical protein
MSNNESNKDIHDVARIRLHEEYEVYYWTHKFNCTEQQLREAVREVGNGVEAVRRFLEMH